MAAIFLVLSGLTSAISGYQLNPRISYRGLKQPGCLHPEGSLSLASAFGPLSVYPLAVCNQESALECLQVMMQGNSQGESVTDEYIRFYELGIISDQEDFKVPSLKCQVKQASSQLKNFYISYRLDWAYTVGIILKTSDPSATLSRYLLNAGLTISMPNQVSNSEHCLACLRASKGSYYGILPSFRPILTKDSHIPYEDSSNNSTKAYILKHLYNSLYTSSFISICLISCIHLLLIQFQTSRNKLIIMIFLLLLPFSQGCSSNCLDCESSTLCLNCQTGYRLMDGICLESCPYNTVYDSDISQCIKPTGANSRFTMNSLSGTVKDSISGNLALITGLESTSFYPTADLRDPYPSYLRGYFFYNSYLSASITSTLLCPSFSISLTFRPISSNSPVLVKSKPDGSKLLYIYMQSNQVNIQILVYNNTLMKEQIITLSCPYFIVMNQWNSLIFTFRSQNESSRSEFSCYVSEFSSMSSYQTIYTFYDFNNSQLIIGAFNSTYFTGHIYEISTYYAMSRQEVYSLEYTSNCIGCDYCPTTLSPMCLSSCFYNYDTDCIPCPESCNRGVCLSPDSCNLCYDSNCNTCDDYKQGSCTACSSYYILVNGECKCGDGAYIDTANNSCKPCSSVCKTCSGPTVKDCIECADSAFKYDSICYSECPFGTISQSNNCVQDSVTKSSLILNRITAGLSDSLSNTYLAGNDTSTFDHYSDLADPIPAYHRGYYFKGNQFLVSQNPVARLGHRFSVSFIIKPEGNGTFYCRGDKTTPYFAIGLSSQYIQVIMKTTNYDINQRITYGIIPLNQWSHILLSMDYDKTNSTFKLYYNNAFYGSASFPNTIYYESSPPYVTIGAIMGSSITTNYYSGYIYSACNDLTVFSSGTISQTYISCYDCIYEIIGQGCLNDCPISKIPDNCNISCPTSCVNTGCVRQENCNLCQDPKCAMCSSFDTTECIQCIANASGSPCTCDSGYYLNQNTGTCSTCYNGCQTCSGPEFNACLTCSIQYYLYYNTCVSSCPLGYTSDNTTNKCILTQSPFASWNFNVIQNTVYDSVNNLSADCGLTGNFYPNYDTNDPKAVYKRGYYFDGVDDMIFLNPIQSTYLQISHSVAVWFRPESLQDSTLLSKLAGSSSNIWELKILNSALQFSFQISRISSITIPNTLSIGEWYHIVISCQHINLSSIVTAYLNGVQVSTATYEYQYFQDNSAYFLIGCKSTSSEQNYCFNGYIFSVSLYNNHLDSTNVSSLISNSCSEGSCDICPVEYGKCLPKCSRLEGVSDSGDCIQCLDKCSDGCRDGTRCNLCKDYECSRCTDYEDTVCEECISNATLNSGDCKCIENSFVYKLEEEACKPCPIGCINCYGPEYWKCTECDSTKSLYLFLGTCLSYCPLGYILDDNIPRTCKETDNKLASFTFDKIQGIVPDTQGVFEFTTGTSANFYPSYDSSDPYGAYNRGYYFDGASSYMKLTSNPILFAKSFSISLWVKPESNNLQTLLSKVDSIMSPSFLLSLDNLYPRIDYSKTTGLTQEALSHKFDRALELNTWSFILFAVNHQNSTSELICYINTQKSSTITGSGFYLDSSDYDLYLGFKNTISDYFQGFIYNIQIFNSYLDSLEGLFSTSCVGGCDICPIGTCLSDCGYDEYEEAGVCTSCPDKCLLGCRNGNQCSLCSDPVCEVCSDYMPDTCSQCYDLASLDSNNRCVCQVGYYWAQTEESCKMCSSMCETCTDIGVNNCILCSQGYFKTPEQLCLQECPIGYTANVDDRVCIQNNTPGLMVSVTFDSFNPNKGDSVSGFNIEYGSSVSYFPNYDENDPITIPKSGLYISSNKYAILLGKNQGYSLGNSFTTQIWVRATTQDAEEVILQKLNQSTGEYSLSLSITSYGSYRAKFLLSSTITDETGYFTLETSSLALRFLQASSSWDRVTIILHYDGFNTIAELILNTNPGITFSIPNHYFKDSLDKVIQFGNRNSNSTFQGFIQNFKIYNIHMTHDQATADFPSNCACSACTEYGCISTCNFNQVEVDGSCQNCLSSCSYGCLRTTDCHMNEDMLCETYSWYRASDCNSCISNAVKTDTGCKCNENSTFNPIERKCECDQNYWLNVDKCELCVRWIQSDEVSAYFDENYRFVIYEFSQSVKLDNLDCTNIFSSETIAKFGTDYTCKFDDAAKLTVFLGSGATLVDENTVILEGKLKSMESECNYPSSTIDVTVAFVYSKPEPTALIYRIDNHYIECGDLTISGSRSEGALGRSLEYKWLIESYPAIPALDKYSISDFSSQDTLSISNQDLEPTSLTITLTVRNFLNMIDSITHTTNIAPGVGITVLFDPSVYYDIYRREYRTYSPRPVGQCEISDSLEYSWSYQGISNNHTVLDVDLLMSYQKTTRMFLVHPNILPAGSIVTFRANITDTESGARGYGEFDIPVTLSEPIIITDRANGDIGVSQPLNVDASKSFDPDEISSLEYEWSCSYLSRSCSEVISNPNSETLQIPSGTMEPDTQYEFTLKVTKSVPNPTSSRKLQSTQVIYQKVLLYNTKIYPVPDANIVVENQDSSYSTSYSTISELHLKLVLNDDDNSYTIKWSKVQGGSIRFLSPDNGLYLVIAGGSMDPGTLYTIEASLQDNEYTYRYYLDIYTNSPPLYGKLTAYPSKGDEFSTIFKLEASDWVDIDYNYPLQYGFGYVALGEDKTLNSKNSTNIYYTQLPFCTDNLFLYAYDSLESYTRTDFQIEVEYLESLSTEQILEIYVQKLNDPRTDPLEMLGIANLLAIGGISREFYNTGIYPNKTQEEIEMIYTAFNLAADALRTLLISSDYFSVQTLYGSVSVLNSLTDSPYLKNDTDTRLTVIDLLTYTIDLAYGNDVIEDRLINMAVGTNDQIINFDSGDMYEYPTNMVDVISAYDYILGSKIITMVPGQILEGESENTKYKLTVVEIDNLNSMTLSMNNSVAEIMLPSTISEDVKKLYPDVEELGLLIMDIDIETKNVSRADPSIVVFSIFDAKKEVPESLNVSLSEYFTMKIPLNDVPEVWDPTCGFLNVTIKMWDARGCKLVSYNDEYGVCSCNHFTAFSLDEGLDQAGATFDNSNIDMTTDVDAFNDIEWSGNAIGLYFCIGVLFMYAVIGTLLCIMDFKDDKNSQLARANSKPQKVELVQTPNIDNIIMFEEVILDDPKHPSHRKYTLPFIERSTDRNNPQISQSDEIYELRPEDIEFLEKAEREASLKNIKKSWWNRYKEKHSILNLFLHFDPEMKRFPRLTLVVAGFLGSMFFIGMFYDSEGKTEDAEEEKTFLETMKEYSWNDFWIMIYSTVIMAAAMIILGKIFTITPITVDTEPDLEKKIRRRNKIKMIVGYIIAFGMIGYFVWSIILFSIQFNVRASNMWIFSTSLSFVWETIVGQTYKLAIKTLVIVVLLTFKAKRDQKKLEQGDLEDGDGKKESKERRRTRAETTKKLPIQHQSNEECKTSSKQSHSNQSDPIKRSEEREPEIIIQYPFIQPPIDDSSPKYKKKRKSNRDRSSKRNSQ